MYGQQMELFNDGGLKDEGGMVDEVSGNDVPPGSTRKEVRDDIPAMLSEGEFVFPADVVRYFGLERLMEMRQQAKMGLQKMEAMGQMGNSEEATIPDDLPFSPEDLIIMSPQEFNTGGVVQAQQGMFFQPSSFEGTELNTSNNIPPSSLPVTNSQGTYTGYFPSFVDQAAIQPTGQNETITSGADTGTDFVPTVDDVYTFEKYINESTGEIRDFPFYMGEPVIPIPEGFVPYSEEQTTATEDVTDTGVETAQVIASDDSGGFDPTTGEPTGQQATPVGDLSNEDLMSNLSESFAIARAGSLIGSAINPAIGAVVGVAAKARYNDLFEEAQRRGLDTGGRERMGSVFGGEESLYSGLQDQSGDQKVSFADTWMGDLLGLDGKAGVQGPGLQESRQGARRGATTTSTARTVASSGQPSQAEIDTQNLLASQAAEAERKRQAEAQAEANREAQATRNDDDNRSWNESVKAASDSVRSGTTQAAGATSPSRDITSEKYTGKGYTTGRAKGGFIIKPNEQPKTTPNKKRGVAARKKK